MSDGNWFFRNETQSRSWFARTLGLGAAIKGVDVELGYEDVPSWGKLELLPVALTN
jgi:hypothetical protein